MNTISIFFFYIVGLDLIKKSILLKLLQHCQHNRRVFHKIFSDVLCSGLLKLWGACVSLSENVFVLLAPAPVKTSLFPADTLPLPLRIPVIIRNVPQGNRPIRTTWYTISTEGLQTDVLSLKHRADSTQGLSLLTDKCESGQTLALITHAFFQQLLHTQIRWHTIASLYKVWLLNYKTVIQSIHKQFK